MSLIAVDVQKPGGAVLDAQGKGGPGGPGDPAREIAAPALQPELQPCVRSKKHGERAPQFISIRQEVANDAAGDFLFLLRRAPLHRKAQNMTMGRVDIQGARQVACRVIFVSGAARGFGPQQEILRLRLFAAAKAIRILKRRREFAAAKSLGGQKRQRLAMALQVEKQGFAVQVPSGCALEPVL